MALLFNIHVKSVWRWTNSKGSGILADPVITYPLSGNPNAHGKSRKAFWTRQQLEDLCENMAGTRAKNRIPSQRQINAMDKYDMVIYARTPDGEFVPMWEAEDW